MDFDFSHLFSSIDIEFVWSLLKGIVLHSITLFTPVIKVRSKSYPKWFHSAIHHQLHRLHYLHRCYRKYPSPMRSSQLSSDELQLQQDIVFAWFTYETDLVTNFAFSNDSRIYQYIRNLSGQNNLPTVLCHGSAMATSRAKKAELLNYFFHSVFNVSSGSLQLDTSLCPKDSLFSVNISLSDTFIGLASLDPSKAMGGDGILPVILKHSTTALAELVHHLFSLRHTCQLSGVDTTSLPFLNQVIDPRSQIIGLFLFFDVSPIRETCF